MQMDLMRQASVLVVDGSENDRKQLKNILALRVKLWGVNAGCEALANMGNTSPDLVLLSADLPDMDGFELLRRMREDVQLREIPVIMMTTNQSQKAEAAITMAGASENCRARSNIGF